MLRSAYQTVEILLSLPLKVASAGVITVTAHVAVRLVPSEVLAVMVAVPLLFAVTTPELLTVATVVLLLVHDTLLLVALDGKTVAVRGSVCPMADNTSVVLSS